MYNIVYKCRIISIRVQVQVANIQSLNKDTADYYFSSLFAEIEGQYVTETKIKICFLAFLSNVNIRTVLVLEFLGKGNDFKLFYCIFSHVFYKTGPGQFSTVFDDQYFWFYLFVVKIVNLQESLNLIAKEIVDGSPQNYRFLTL